MAARRAPARSVRVMPASTGHVLRASLSFPPSTQCCRENIGISWYSPLQYQRTYELTNLYNKGITGTMLDLDTDGKRLSPDVAWNDGYGATGGGGLFARPTYQDPVAGIVDITSGDNSFAGVTGYPALPGYDLTTGLGTVNAARFVPTLAAGG